MALAPSPRGLTSGPGLTSESPSIAGCLRYARLERERSTDRCLPRV